MLTIEQVIAEERKAHAEYEAKTVATTINGVSYTIADLRKVSDAIFDPKDWKAAWCVAVPHNMVAVCLAAGEWFQGRKPTIGGIQPLTGKVYISSEGYAY